MLSGKLPYSGHGKGTEASPHPNQLAKLITDIATGEAEQTPDTRDPAAVVMGSKGGKTRASSMTAERRAEIARKAAAKRWSQ